MKKTVSYSLTLLALLLSTLLFSQKKNPDAIYHQNINKIDALQKEGKTHDAVNTFMELEKGYKIWGMDMITFLQVAIADKNAPAFELALKWMLENSFMAPDELVNDFAANGMDIVQADKALLAIYEKYNKLPRTWAPGLNLRDMYFMQNIMATDRSIRWSIPAIMTVFPAITQAQIDSIITPIDSLNFELFYAHCERYGFPKWTELGLDAGRMQTFLSHISFLGMGEKETDKTPMFIKRLTMAGWINTRVNEGEFPGNFFKKNLLGHIKYILEKNNRANDFEHFRPFLN